MSAQEHRSEAALHEDEAEAHEGRYDPEATAVRRAGSAAADFAFGVDVYNPTARHLAHAESHRDEAAQHSAAAATLGAYEEGRCGDLPPETRAACPLLGQIRAVTDIPSGARVRFADDVNMQAATAHVECHIAFARAHGREGMDRCPLYVSGVEPRPGPDERTLDLTTERPAGVAAVRSRARTHTSAE